MRDRLSKRLLIAGILATAFAGCARRTLVTPRDTASLAEEAAPVVRAKNDDAEPDAAKDTPAFRFPDDRGGALLAKVLPPEGHRGPLAEKLAEPRRSAPAHGVESPTMPLPSNPTAVPRLPSERTSKPLQPRLTVEEALAGTLGHTGLPHTLSLPAGDRVRVASVDVHQPPPLPILATPASDRASLADPTIEASFAAATSAPLPPRVAPAPYLRQALPDPYENRKPLRLPIPDEGPSPVTATPQPPKP